MELIFMLLIGVVIGFGLRSLIKQKVAGTLRVDRSDPEDNPYLFLELTKDGMDRIRKHRYITLEVKIKNYISRD